MAPCSRSAEAASCRQQPLPALLQEARALFCCWRPPLCGSYCGGASATPMIQAPLMSSQLLWHSVMAAALTSPPRTVFFPLRRLARCQAPPPTPLPPPPAAS
jgi:hypothetical protein